MREDLLKQIEQEYEDLRRNHEREELARKADIQQNEPVIAELMNAREKLIHGTLKNLLRGRGQTEDLPARMAEISSQIREALEKAGYPADYLAPIYRCGKCRDTGYVGEVVKTPCECLKTRYQEKLRAEMGLAGRNEETFERFDLSVFPDTPLPGSGVSQRAMMETVRTLCENWANQYPDNRRRDVMLMGKSGLGKTFLLHCMANRLLERGIELRIVSAYGFLQTARKSYFENDQGLEELLGVPVLLLDDLGSEPLMQNVTIEQLFNLINERQARRLSTIVSTNLNTPDFKTRYTERIASRMTDARNCLVITLEGQDIRRSGRG